jgi:hypothetical protein
MESQEQRAYPGKCIHPWNNNTQQTPARLFLVMMFEAIKTLPTTAEKKETKPVEGQEEPAKGEIEPLEPEVAKQYLNQFYYLLIKLLSNPVCQYLYSDKLWILTAIYNLLHVKFENQVYWEYFLKVGRSLFEEQLINIL